MDKARMRKEAEEILICSADKIEEREIIEINAVYYRNTNRGGGAVILAENGEKLFVDPFFIDYNEHLRRFINGERTMF